MWLEVGMRIVPTVPNGSRAGSDRRFFLAELLNYV
jgi:hypothetical protein